MSNISKRIAALSPEQRALLEHRLKGERIQDTLPCDDGVNNLQPELVSKSQQNSKIETLSFAQERLWLLHQLQPELPLYNEINLFKLTGSLDISLLEKSFNQVLQRHQVL
ncbi:MAG: condensation domain-containing protein, partial [Waterburya sp.]